MKKKLAEALFKEELKIRQQKFLARAESGVFNQSHAASNHIIEDCLLEDVA